MSVGNQRDMLVQLLILESSQREKKYLKNNYKIYSLRFMAILNIGTNNNRKPHMLLNHCSAKGTPGIAVILWPSTLPAIIRCLSIDPPQLP